MLHWLFDNLRTATYFLGVLSVLIIVHEWGHFIVAKLCGMQVDDFSLFFGKRILRLGTRNGTEYNVRTVPLGGFVKIAGMEPDDLSNGAPLFRKGSGFLRNRTPLQTLRGLRQEDLAEIDPDRVSDRVAESVTRAVGQDSRLTDWGREELKTLLRSVEEASDDQRYIRAVLEADAIPPNPHGFNQKPLWQRASVIFAGPFMSVLFGYVLFCVMGFTTGIPADDKTENRIAQIVPGRPAERAGLKPGDAIVQINNTWISSGKTMIDIIHASANKELSLLVQRGEKTFAVRVTPLVGNVEEPENGKIVTKKVGLLGFTPVRHSIWRTYTPAESVRRGTQIVAFEVTTIVKTLQHIRFGANANISGPIGIVSQIHSDSKEGVRQVMVTAALLSVSVGLINLIPIPILDGGHLLLLTIEGVRRRKLSSTEVYAAQMVGLSIIGVLFVLVMFNDFIHVILPHGR